jgi:hypothetical protein
MPQIGENATNINFYLQDLNPDILKLEMTLYILLALFDDMIKINSAF